MLLRTKGEVICNYKDMDIANRCNSEFDIEIGRSKIREYVYYVLNEKRKQDQVRSWFLLESNGQKPH